MRRYSFNCSQRPEILRFDTVILGSGIAGLYAALNLDPRLSCAILTKERVDLSNSWLAQGGIAAAVSPEDQPQFHYEDTRTAGAGLCNESAVRVMVDEGPGDIAALRRLQVPFDLDMEGELQIGREGGHGFNRIVHAKGDATGREMVKTLTAIAAARENITFFQDTFVMDILTENGRALGVAADCNGMKCFAAEHILVCTGGIGQIYTHSTNPSVATGDGLAAAFRAGARLSHMEFVQFHPTGLYTKSPSGNCFLISEAVRGEGGLLKNSEGERFMVGQHPMNELAPRDIVARCIVREMEKTGTDHVFLDITSRPASFLSVRFPTIYGECLSRGIDISKDAIPVFPIQHYVMGGIDTDLNGRSCVPGLYACGEAAHTGVHGANRLASNSMLECLVFGRRAARHISASASLPQTAPRWPAPEPVSGDPPDAEGIRQRIRTIMSRDGWIIRTKAGLKRGLAEMHAIKQCLEAGTLDTRERMETLNMATVSLEILKAALLRETSIGAHYRED